MRLLHLGDIHIGVENYGRIDPATGYHTRLQDFARCLERAVDLALEHEVDAVLFAGDAYRTATPSPTHQQVLAGALLRLLHAGLPIVMITGNHDLPVSYGRATSLDIFATFAPEQVKVVRRPELVTLATRSGPLQVACVPWPTRSSVLADEEIAGQADRDIRIWLETRLRAVIDQLAEQVDVAQPAVLLSHLTVMGASFTGSEQMLLGSVDPVVSPGMLANPRFDYVALGHVHRHQNLNPTGRPAVVYCGSLDRIDFGEAKDAKGVCLVTLGEGADPAARAARYDFLAVPARPFVPIELDIAPEAEPTEWLVKQIDGFPIADAVVRLRYRCTDDQERALDLRAVRAALREAHLVAGITRERPADPRRPRVEINEHHDTLDALGRYLDSRPDLTPLREELLVAAREFDEQLTRRDDAG